MDCFVCERVHSRIKGAAVNVRNTRSFEASVLSRSLMGLASQMDDCFVDRLLGRVQVAPEIAADVGGGVLAYVSMKMHWRGHTYTDRDIVVANDQVFMISGCADVDGVFMLIVSRCEMVARVTSACDRFRLTEGLQYLQMVNTRMWFPHMWSWESDVLFLVLS